MTGYGYQKYDYVVRWETNGQGNQVLTGVLISNDGVVLAEKSWEIGDDEDIAVIEQDLLDELEKQVSN